MRYHCSDGSGWGRACGSARNYVGSQQGKAGAASRCFEKGSMLVPGCIDEDRTTPESSPSFKVWLGILRETLETSVLYGEDVGEDLGYGFPVDALGIQKLPFAKALVAIAKNHFEFATAAEGGSAPGAPEVERRMTALEEMMREMRDGMRQLSKQPGTAAASKKAPKLPAPSVAAGGLPAGMDPGLARQAMMSGVTPSALGEFAHMLGGQNPRPNAPLPRQLKTAQAVISDDEPEGEEADDPPEDAGSGNPVEKAVIQLSRIVSQMVKDKKVKADRSLEALLDRAESGGALPLDGVASSSKSKSAALRSLRKLLIQQPELIYRAIEQKMEEDWIQAGTLPGASSSSSITARGCSSTDPRSRTSRCRSEPHGV